MSIDQCLWGKTLLKTSNGKNFPTGKSQNCPSKKAFFELIDNNLRYVAEVIQFTPALG